MAFRALLPATLRAMRGARDRFAGSRATDLDAGRHCYPARSVSEFAPKRSSTLEWRSRRPPSRVHRWPRASRAAARRSTKVSVARSCACLSLFLLEPLALRSELLEPRRPRHASIAPLWRAPRQLAPSACALLHRAFGVLERHAATRVAARALASRPGPSSLNTMVDLLELDLIARDVRALISAICCSVRSQVLALPLDQILTMLKRLLEPSDLGADPVVAALNRVECARCGRLARRAASRCDVSVERCAAMAASSAICFSLNDRSCSPTSARKRIQTKGKQLGTDLALLGFEDLVAFCVLRLASADA